MVFGCFRQKNETVKTFGLDRISNLKITDTKFKPVAYNVEKEFQHAFGVETYEAAKKVILEFSKQQGNYIKTFPLHKSQRIVKETEDAVSIEIFIHTTNDIKMELLKYGSNVKVIAPISLQNDIKNRISEMSNLYIWFMEKEEFVHLFSKRIDKLERTFKEKFPDGIDDRTTATIPLGFMNRLVIDGRQYKIEISGMNITNCKE